MQSLPFIKKNSGDLAHVCRTRATMETFHRTSVFFIPCRTPLHYAAGHVHYESVVLLVGSGCSVNKSDTKSCTALHYASAHDEDAKYEIQPRIEKKPFVFVLE